MRQAEFYAACYCIIKNEKGHVLFQKRQNTGFRDGEYQVPAGHLEGLETLKECAIREMKEELNIDIQDNDIEIKHISHRVSTDKKVYFDAYLEVTSYSGELSIMEPEKCSSLDFIDIHSLKNPELFSYDLDIIQGLEKGEAFSDFVM